jgi:NAD(P)-dependent dehydrogenase (short-subunit alcohol dehydrogenase family)
MTATSSPRSTVVVTGGARGIGFSLAEAFAASGMNVALLDLLDTVGESAEKIAQAHGVDAVGIAVDVTDQQAMAAAFDQVTEAVGTPQVLLAAAGICVWHNSVDLPAEQWRKVISVNLDGTFYAAQAFATGLIEHQLPGSAIFISSMSASIVNVPQHQASYNASKAAVTHLGRSLAVEWAGAGIRVNSISPGYVLSDMTRQLTEREPELRRDWTARIPQGRMAEPQDLHGLALFLASDASAYITGQEIIIDGGYTAV